MNNTEIQSFLNKEEAKNGDCVKITFRERAAIYGLFVTDTDYNYLKQKNFWRIVPQSAVSDFQKSGNMSLSRIYNGAEIIKLTTYKDSFDL